MQAMAELLTTNKLSELACLTLYLMYEKKNGRQSVWYEFIKVRASWHALLLHGALSISSAQALHASFARTLLALQTSKGV